jgi:type IV pilus biogenesis protein CpaD/CtpE
MNTARNCLILAALLQGCSTAPRFEAHFGDSVRANLAAQLIDPSAHRNADPVAGIDGGAARASHERYQRSFQQADAGMDKPLVGANGK